MRGYRRHIFRRERHTGLPLQTDQTTCYSIGDDGDYEAGLAKGYRILTLGGFSGNSNLDCPHYAAALAFINATSKITDAANGLVTVLTGDTVVVKGTADNDGTYTVATGGVAGEIVVNEALTNEAAGAPVKIYKRAALSNNCVFDKRTGLTWARYSSDGLKHGEASDGKLDWYDAAGSCFELHAAAADLQMIASTYTLRIVGGAGEVAVYDVGDPIVCSGFADADNNLPNWVIQSVDVNGADLDLVLGPTDSNKLADLASEAAGGARDINLVCRGIFGYAAAANAASLGGRTGWRIPCDLELASLRNMEAASAVPNAAAFPGWTGNIWSSTSNPAAVGSALQAWYGDGRVRPELKASMTHVSLVRG